MNSFCWCTLKTLSENAICMYVLMYVCMYHISLDCHMELLPFSSCAESTIYLRIEALFAVEEFQLSAVFKLKSIVS